ncbi:MAG TPA: EAL domain-containing protein [Acidimicrobiales bacterium]|nr:EAL domain-containing protein [Acidimicrobiales bacterium]
MDLAHRGDGDIELLAAPGSAVPPSEALASIASRVVRAYAVAAASWIVVSDVVVGVWTGDGASGAGIAKGLLFVAVTAAVLWVVLRRLTAKFDRMFTGTVRAQRDFYGSILATSSDIVAIFAGDGRTVYVNDAITERLGWLPSQIVGRPGRDIIHPADRIAALSFRDVVAVGGGADEQRTLLLRHRDGSYRAMEVRGAPIRLADGDPGVVINARDVTDRARSERQLRAALAEDVTGLPGLRLFMAEMDGLEELQPGGLRATVALVDVDRFRDVNQLHGRGGGDEVLRELARRLEAAVPEALGIWRHGADEFVLLILDDGDDRAVEPTVLAERVRAVAGVPVLLAEDGARASVEVSVGVARLALSEPTDEPLGTVLLRAAESALLEAKTHPDRVSVRRSTASAPTGDRARQVAELHEALEREELVVHYQPKVRLGDLGTAGAEALVRWQHPTRGLLAPGEFLPAVAEANLSPAVLRVVLRDALHHVRDWAERPGCDPDFMVCVNVSADDLRRRRFADDVLGAVDEAGVAPRRLCLELTEQAMLADPSGARSVLDELRRSGISVAIDDFGTGYSTLEHIRVFEVDGLKIDKGFVQRLGESPADEAIVDSVLAIALRLGLRVTAEGIEHVVALDYLRDRGCAVGQGYLFSRPVPAARIDPCGRFGPFA